MNFVKARYVNVIVLMFGCMLLVACGGGGGGDEEAFTEAVDVNELNITAIELTSVRDTIEPDMIEFYSATGIVGGDPMNTMDVSDRVSWSSTNNGVASINSAGIATGNTAGTTTIRATWADLSASKSLTVSNAALNAIVIEDVPASVPVCSYGHQLRAIGQYADGDRDITANVTWASDDLDLAIVDLDGVVATYTDGDVDISASRDDPVSSNPVVGNETLTIDDNLLSIAVTPVDTTITVDSSRQFVATASYSGGPAPGDATLTSFWQSDDDAIVSISNEAGAEGLAIAESVGATTVNATCNGVTSNDATATVEAAVTLTGIQINGGDAEINTEVNDSPIDLVARLVYSDNSTINVTDDDDVDWRVGTIKSGTGATVSNDPATKGEVSFTATGVTEIIVRYDGDLGGPFEDSIDIDVE